MIRKFFLVILSTYLQSACTLSATDIYPKNLPDLFWEFRTHFYSRLSNPAATKEDFQNTICEFVRVCDYIPADFVVKDKLREDFNKHGLSIGLSADVLVGVLSALDELEAREAITLGDSSSIRSLTGNGAVATTSHLQEAFDLYPHNISSFFGLHVIIFMQTLHKMDALYLNYGTFYVNLLALVTTWHHLLS